MKYAVSIYLGGKLIDANKSDYNEYKDLGIVCPYCKESLHLTKGHMRKGKQVSSHWTHYKISLNTRTCELRALSKEGKEKLEKLQPKARNQRLALFNERFWDVYKFDKNIPVEFNQLLNKDITNEVAKHCWELWDVKAIWASLNRRIEYCSNKKILDASVEKHFSDKPPEFKEYAKSIIDNVNFDIVKIKIIHEVISWLATPTAKRAFKKLIALAMIDTLEIEKPPIHTNTVANMAINGLIFTDWEKAIEHVLANPLKKKGFG